jgi:mono/diheme cytochrome c family protein
MIGPELNAFGDKTPDLLSFGDTVTNPQEQTWERWTTLKLLSPRAFRTEREKLVMPENGLSPEEVTALAVYLKSLRVEDIPLRYQRSLSPQEQAAEEGERMFKELNCRGCHVEDGRGGELRAALRDPGLFPPDLTGEGAKVQPAWLFQFLKKPSVLRPWLTMRMPDFGLSDAAAGGMVNYFMAQAGKNDLLVQVPADLPADLYAQTAAVFDQLKCIQCHQLTLGENQTLSDLAPDMGLTRYRLRPEWMEDFIIDPQALMPGTKMPSFFPREDDEDPDSIMTPLPAWLAGDPRAQIRAIRDYLYVMSSQPAVAVPGPSGPAPLPGK